VVFVPEDHKGDLSVASLGRSIALFA